MEALNNYTEIQKRGSICRLKLSPYRINMCLFQNLRIYYIKWITILPYEKRSHYKTPTCLPEKTFHNHKPTRIPLWLDYLILKQKIRQRCLYWFLSRIRPNISPKNYSKTISLRHQGNPSVMDKRFSFIPYANCKNRLSVIPLRLRNQRCSSRKRPWTNIFPPFYKRHNRFYKPGCRGNTFCRRS